MLSQHRNIVKIICNALCDNFKSSRERKRRDKHGIFQRREIVFQEASTCIELLYLWGSVCGELRLRLHRQDL